MHGSDAYRYLMKEKSDSDWKDLRAFVMGIVPYLRTNIEAVSGGGDSKSVQMDISVSGVNLNRLCRHFADMANIFYSSGSDTTARFIFREGYYDWNVSEEGLISIVIKMGGEWVADDSCEVLLMTMPEESVSSHTSGEKYTFVNSEVLRII